MFFYFKQFNSLTYKICFHLKHSYYNFLSHKKVQLFPQLNQTLLNSENLQITPQIHNPMSDQDDRSFLETSPATNFQKVTSNSHITSQKIINKSKQDVNPLMLSQSLQRSTYLNGADLEQDSEETPQQFTPNSLMLTSFHDNRNAQQTQQKPVQPKNSSPFNMEKSISKHHFQIHHQHHQQHQQVYESISSDHSSEGKQQKPKTIQTSSIQQTPFENDPIQPKNFQPSATKKQSFVNIKSEAIKQEEMKPKESPTIQSGKYNVSLKKEQSLQQKHATFELPRKNVHITQKANEPMFKRQESYDLKPVTSQRSNRINIEKSHQNPQIKYPSINIRSNSQQSGYLKLEARKPSAKDTPIEFQQTKDPSTSQKNLAYVSKRFTSEQPSPKRNDEFNEVYQIEAPLPKNQKKIETFEEIKNAQQHSHLLYISASGQVVYPSLDLGKKAKELQNKNKQVQQLKMESHSFEKGRESKKDQEKRRKPSTQPELPYRIRILQYRSEYFLKIETQVFDIEVEFQPDNKVIEMKNMRQPSKQGNEQRKSQKNYRIKRRFSDFAFLYEGIMTNQIGYIIYPFPSKSLESFVKIKLQSLIGTALSDGSNATEMQKVQLLQKRIQELQNFVNYLMTHDELKHSQELGIFLSEDPDTYQKSRDRIEKYIQEYKELQSSTNLLESGKKNIKKALESGFGMVMKWWSSQQQPVKDLNNKIQKSKQSMQLLVDTTIPQDDIEFGQYFETIGICLAKFQMLQRTMLKLCEINHKFISFKDIDTEFDYLVKLCAKVSSGKEYSKNLVQMIEYDLIRDIEIGRRWFEQSKQQLIKRQELKELVETLKSSLTYANDESSKISKLERRIERFQKNFKYGFSHLIIECEKTFEKSRIKFTEAWQSHSLNMKKIWK